MFLNGFRFSFSTFRAYSSLVLSVKEIVSKKPVNEKVVVQGWVQSIRKHKNLCFVDVTDGSCFERLQVVLQTDGKSVPAYGSSVQAEGTLVKSNHKGQDVELQCNSWKEFGSCPEDYPFCNRLKYSSEYVRQFLHLRSRTKTFGSVLRIRNCAAHTIHCFFQDNGFLFTNTPILTQSSCEGAGEVFSVHTNKSSEAETSSCKTSVGNLPSHAMSSIPNKAIPVSADMESDDEMLPDNFNGDEFFGIPTYLTVSGQLQLETFACSHSRVYTFGPVFRAEHSRTRMHASEFLMVEAEMAFIDTLEELTKFVEQLINQVVKSILDKHSSEVSWLSEKYPALEKNYIETFFCKPFSCMTYTEAINILKSNSKSLECSIKWGDDLGSEHKHFLVKYCNNAPVFVTMAPASMMPFYMKDDGNGMAFSFDLLAPFGGEICSGSLRIDSEETLRTRLESLGTKETLSWYMDLLKYGAVPHGGFGIGFDRLLQSILSIPNIRDIIPYPRRKNDCKC